MTYRVPRLTRRSLLNISWRSLAVASVAHLKSLAAIASPAARGLEHASADSFDPLTGTMFQFRHVSGEGSPLALRLTAVTRHANISRIEAQMPAIRGARKRESFSLLFELAGDDPLPPGLHEMASGEFRGSPLFLSRVERSIGKEPLRYEAVFG